MLVDKLEFSEELVNTNNSAFNYFLSNYGELGDEINTLDAFNNGINSIGTKKKWGFYNVLASKTMFKNDTIFKSALIGKSKDNKDRLALYVTDYDNSFKLSGKSIINGDVKVPNGKVESGYIDNKIRTSLSINGSKLTSEDALPKLNDILDFDLFDSEMQTLEGFETPSITNDFNKETVIIDVSNSNNIENFELKGNVILYSKNPIKIEKSATIEDILVVAPSVVIASDFVGNLQIISKEKVEVNSNALLKYPSSIYIENDADSIKVTIKEKAKIAGGIVINGNTYNGSLKRLLVIEPNTQIIGDVYCYGKTQLEGEITGTIYSDRFILKTRSSEYENIIQNCNIDRDKLPENFVRLPLFNDQNSRYEIVKEF